MYKISNYTFLIPIREKKVSLILNIMYGGLFEFQEKETNFLNDLIAEKKFEMADIPEEYQGFVNKLIDANYFLSEDIDEIAIYQKNYETYRRKFFENGRLAVTITPTLACNMACRYCFQNGTEARMMKEETMSAIVSFLENRIIDQGGIDAPHKTLHLTWFGGEPLLAANRLDNFTDQLVTMCEKYKFEYSAGIVTNGTLLNEKNWEIIKKCKVTNIQVTLDGPAETHNIRRLCKTNNGKTYEHILSNLENLPEDIHLTIRINCDKIVWNKIHRLLDDLEEHGIWPQHAKQINLALAFISSYENARFDDCEWYFNFNEFYDIGNQFIDVKLEHYNNWAEKNGKKPAKKVFKTPLLNFEECYSAVNPNGFVIDADGYIHKCWEDVDKSETGISHVTEPYNNDTSNLHKWLLYDKTKNKKCRLCKFLPVCGPQCTKKMIEDNRNQQCIKWKYTLKKEIKRQYIEKLEHPELYVDF